MPAGRKISKKKDKAGPDDIARYVVEFQNAKAMADAATKRMEQFKKYLRDAVEEEGYEDDKGNKWLDIEGVEGVTAIKHEKRVSRTFDVGRAETWVKKNGLWEQCSTTVTLLDEDKVLAAAYEGAIPERTMSGFYTERESWAFKVQ